MKKNYHMDAIYLLSKNIWDTIHPLGKNIWDAIHLSLIKIIFFGPVKKVLYKTGLNTYYCVQVTLYEYYTLILILIL